MKSVKRKNRNLQREILENYIALEKLEVIEALTKVSKVYPDVRELCSELIEQERKTTSAEYSYFVPLKYLTMEDITKIERSNPKAFNWLLGNTDKSLAHFDSIKYIPFSEMDRTTRDYIYTYHKDSLDYFFYEVVDEEGYITYPNYNKSLRQYLTQRGVDEEGCMTYPNYDKRLRQYLTQQGVKNV